MRLFLAPINDDRGVQYNACPEIRKLLFPLPHPHIPMPLGGLLAYASLWGGGLLSIAVIFLGIVFTQDARTDGPVYFATVLGILVFGVFASAYQYLASKYVRPTMVRRFVFDGFCPSCAELIGGKLRDPDGCVTCAECGAAWRLPKRQNEDAFAYPAP